MNGFKAAGIVDAVERQLYVNPADAHEGPSDDNPFAKLTDDD